MAADTGVRLSVWVLGEYAFCPRAGLIAHRSRFDGEVFQEDDDSYGRLDFLPEYDAAEIERAIAATRRLLIRVFVAAAWLAAAAYILGDLVWPGLWWVAVALSLPLPGWTARMLRRLAALRAYARQFRERVPREPDDDLADPTEFNWWDFHRAGFRVVKPRGRYHDPERNLDGCPWRILVRGSVRIPVFRKHRGELSAGRSQFVTLAAYSHLLRVCETAESPYGVILFPGTWTVLVVPDRCGAAAFHTAVDRFRAVLAADAAGQPPARPGGDGPCSGCRHGRPKRLVTDQPAAWEVQAPAYWADEPPAERVPTIHVVGGSSVRPFPAHGVDGHRYHSLCGDLFEWVPPHDTAERVALRTIPHPDRPEPAEVEPSPPLPPPVHVVVNNLMAPYPPAGVPVGSQVAAEVVSAPRPSPLPTAGVTQSRFTPPPSATARPATNDEDEFGAGLL